MENRVIRYERHLYRHGRYCKCQTCNPPAQPSMDDQLAAAVVLGALGLFGWWLSRR